MSTAGRRRAILPERYRNRVTVTTEAEFLAAVRPGRWITIANDIDISTQPADMGGSITFDGPGAPYKDFVAGGAMFNFRQYSAGSIIRLNKIGTTATGEGRLVTMPDTDCMVRGYTNRRIEIDGWRYFYTGEVGDNGVAIEPAGDNFIGLVGPARCDETGSGGCLIQTGGDNGYLEADDIISYDDCVAAASRSPINPSSWADRDVTNCTIVVTNSISTAARALYVGIGDEIDFDAATASVLEIIAAVTNCEGFRDGGIQQSNRGGVIVNDNSTRPTGTVSGFTVTVDGLIVGRNTTCDYGVVANKCENGTITDIGNGSISGYDTALSLNNATTNVTVPT